MADTATSTNPGMDRYNRYYEQVLANLQNSVGPYRTDSQLKNYLQRIIRPGYDQAIQQRQQQTGQANAAIDADAASRGMGTSTWVTDAKARQQNSEAADVAGLNQNYNSALYEALLGQMQQRDEQKMNLASMANSIVGNMYGEFKKNDPANKHSSGGGANIDAKEYYRNTLPGMGGHRYQPGSSTDPTDPGYGLKYAVLTNPYDDDRSYWNTGKKR